MDGNNDGTLDGAKDTVGEEDVLGLLDGAVAFVAFEVDVIVGNKLNVGRGEGNGEGAGVFFLLSFLLLFSLSFLLLLSSSSFLAEAATANRIVSAFKCFICDNFFQSFAK
jgi:hypothetical protein